VTKKRPAKSKASLSDYAMPVATASPVNRRVEIARQRRYEAEEALRTLTRADEHRSNPKLMADVKRLAAKTAAMMQRVAKR
jgi:hypothetical protein